MDAQQCGDIDDDDYDSKLAAQGDDTAINPDRLQAMLDEEQVRTCISMSRSLCTMFVYVDVYIGV